MLAAQNLPIAGRCAPNSCGFRTLGSSAVQLRHRTEQAYGKMRQAWLLPYPSSSGSLPNTCASIATAREKYSRANSVRLAVKTGSVLSLANRMACSALSRKYDAFAIRLTARSGGSMKNSQSPISAENGTMRTLTSVRMFGSGHNVERACRAPSILTELRNHYGIREPGFVQQLRVNGAMRH
jgi:hypothetical protein